MSDNKIEINKHMYFSTEYGKFFLTSEASEIIYRQKGLICSYSGSNEWIHHFTCEMLDLCTGASIYNYALGTVAHEKEIPKIWETNKEAVINFINKSLIEKWGKKMYELIETIIDEVEPN
jgi:L-rhamnose mutarotase